MLKGSGAGWVVDAGSERFDEDVERPGDASYLADLACRPVAIGSALDDADREFAKGRERLCVVLLFDARAVFAERDVEHPVELVFDMPVVTNQ